jgi:hypothetical protein
MINIVIQKLFKDHDDMANDLKTIFHPLGEI